VLNVINNQNVVEERLLTFTATASDSDLPAQDLIFTLDPGAPAGAAITTNGVFTWTPTEAQGTNQYPIVVRVTDNDDSPKSSFQSVILFVAESNQPPVLAVITNRTAVPGDYISFISGATDGDLPANTLSFSLGAGAPAAASIQTLSGLFEWTVPTNQPAGTNTITVIVTDNGAPPRGHSRTFDVIVVAPLRILSIVDGGGNLSISATAIPGRSYTLVVKDDLNSIGGWNVVGSTQVATGTTVNFSTPAAGAQKFYRVLLLP
jgi:hypothetical protein